MRPYAIAFVLLACIVPVIAFADDAADIVELKKQNELLAAKLEAANLKNGKLQKEIDELKAGKKKTPATGKAELEKGAVWTGLFTRKPNATQTDVFTTDARLLITEVKDSGFTGEFWTSNDADGVTVEGEVKSNGKVTFKYVKVLKGTFPKDAIGRIFTGPIIRGKEMKLEFHTPGANRSGTLELKLKE